MLSPKAGKNIHPTRLGGDDLKVFRRRHDTGIASFIPSAFIVLLSSWMRQNKTDRSAKLSARKLRNENRFGSHQH
jgi:hypothetical protein